MRMANAGDPGGLHAGRVKKNTVDGAAGDLAAPEVVKSAPLPAAPVITVTAETVAKGIWWLAGSSNHRSILFEFDDHLTLFEVPLSEARSKAVIDKARSVVPAKPLTQAIVSHHHFDHSGGLRGGCRRGPHDHHLSRQCCILPVTGGAQTLPIAGRARAKPEASEDHARGR